MKQQDELNDLALPRSGWVDLIYGLVVLIAWVLAETYNWFDITGGL